MATRELLADLAAACAGSSGVASVVFESIGGVDAARRVQSGEAFDVVVLAADAIDRLAAAGCLAEGSRVDLVRSPVALAVRQGAQPPAIASEDALRAAVLAARAVGLSTGPSGVHLAGVLSRWGVAPARIVQAPPGVPVAALLARGEVELGFQQLSELMHAPGVTVVGVLPPPLDFVTTFAAARGAASTRGAEVAALLRFFTSPAAAACVRRHGMQPAADTAAVPHPATPAPAPAAAANPGSPA